MRSASVSGFSSGATDAEEGLVVRSGVVSGCVGGLAGGVWLEVVGSNEVSSVATVGNETRAGLVRLEAARAPVSAGEIGGGT
jgi:osmotically-inducible protein OsmY